MRETLKNKIAESLNIIKENTADFENIKVAFSGGKDSVVIYHLAKEANLKATFVYQNTTIDPPGTIQFIKYHFKDVEIETPEKSFYKYIEDKGLPNRWQRWCCEKLKESNNQGFDIVLTGVRRDESSKRANYDIVGKRKDIFELRPILYWNDTDVWEYIKYHNLPIIKYYKSPYNYKRHGCVMCPLADSRQMIKEAKDFPRYAKAMIKAIAKFRKKKAHLAFVQSFTDEYEMFYLFLLQKMNKKGKEQISNNIFQFDTKKQLEKILKINL